MKSPYNSTADFDHPPITIEHHNDELQLYLLTFKPSQYLSFYAGDNIYNRKYLFRIAGRDIETLRGVLNGIDLAPFPPEWNGEPVKTTNKLLEIADEVGDNGGEDFLSLVREYNEWRRLTKP